MQRRLLMSAAECARAVSLLCLLALLWSGQLTLPLLAALGFLGAVGTVAYNVAAPRWCPGWCPRPNWPAPTAGWNWRAAPPSAGPAAGALVSALGASAAYALATALSLLAALLLAGLPADAPAATAARRHIGRELTEGAAFVLRHPLLRPVLVTAVFFNVAWFVLQAVYVVYAIRDLGLDAAGVGLTLGIYGLGMLAGALLAPRLARWLSFGALIAAGPLCALLASALMLLTLARPSPALAALAFFLFGAGPILWTIATTTLRQAVTPNAMLGRVSAVILTATFGARPVGALIGAALAEQVDIAACLWVSALGFALQFAVICASPVPRLRSQPEAVAG